MKTFIEPLVGVCLLAIAGCATTEFKPFEAKVNAFEGRGGTKTIVAEIEVWDNQEITRSWGLSKMRGRLGH